MRNLVAVAVSILALVGCGSEEKTMDMEQLRDFATRYGEAWSSQDPASLAAFFAEEGSLKVNDGEPSVGREAITETARSFMTAFPDMVVTMEEVSLDGNRAVFRWHWTGTNTGPDGTGRSVDLRGYEEWTFSPDGLIAQSLGHFDAAEYERQLNKETGPE